MRLQRPGELGVVGVGSSEQLGAGDIERINELELTGLVQHEVVGLDVDAAPPRHGGAARHIRPLDVLPDLDQVGVRQISSVGWYALTLLPAPLTPSATAVLAATGTALLVSAPEDRPQRP
jgi:hypothetical protein